MILGYAHTDTKNFVLSVKLIKNFQLNLNIYINKEGR